MDTCLDCGRAVLERRDRRRVGMPCRPIPLPSGACGWCGRLRGSRDDQEPVAYRHDPVAFPVGLAARLR